MKFHIVNLLLIALLFTGCSIRKEKLFYVSTQGSADNPGTKEQPFKTLLQAQNAIREYKTSTGKSKKITVIIQPGTYKFKNTLRFQKADSGIDSLDRITFKAEKPGKVFFTGGESIDPIHVKPAKNSPLSRIFIKDNRDSIYFINLQALGITDYGELAQHGFSIAINPVAMELFVNDKPMHLARYPNDSLISVLEVLDPGSTPRTGDMSNRGGTFRYASERPSQWQHTNDAWLHGYFATGYADDNIKVKRIDTSKQLVSLVQPHLYGIQSSLDEKFWAAEHRKFCFSNLPEEIDMPGEYYLDRSLGILYFYPPVVEEIKKIQVSVLKQPMVSFINASNITFDGITFECTRGMAIYLEGGENVIIKNCTFRNLGTVAVFNGQGVDGTEKPIHNFTGIPVSEKVGNLKAHMYDNTTWDRQAGENHLIDNCKIYQTGTGGIVLSGGNRLTLQRGNNTVINCDIHQFNRLNKTYCPGIHIDGVGNKVISTRIYDAPNMGIALFGNEHLVKNCILENVCVEANDMGALYIDRDPSERGNKVIGCVFNENGKTNEQSVSAIYLDDGICGMYIAKNIFRKTGKGYFSAIYVGGGSDNIVKSNLFIDTKSAYNIEGRQTEAQEKHHEQKLAPGGIYHKRLMAVNYDEEPWRSAYPELLAYFEDKDTPKDNPFDNNVIIRSTTFETRTAMDRDKFIFENLELNDGNLSEYRSNLQKRMDSIGIGEALQNTGVKVNDLIEADSTNTFYIISTNQ